MYSLMTKFESLGTLEYSKHNSASEALEEAQRIGFPGEEFEVLDCYGTKVAGIVLASDATGFISPQANT